MSAQVLLLKTWCMNYMQKHQQEVVRNANFSGSSPNLMNLHFNRMNPCDLSKKFAESPGLGYCSVSFSSTKEKMRHFTKDRCNHIVIKSSFLKIKDNFNVICIAFNAEIYSYLTRYTNVVNEPNTIHE